jgi:hypothetical protein
MGKPITAFCECIGHPVSHICTGAHSLCVSAVFPSCNAHYVTQHPPALHHEIKVTLTLALEWKMYPKYYVITKGLSIMYIPNRFAQCYSDWLVFEMCNFRVWPRKHIDLHFINSPTQASKPNAEIVHSKRPRLQFGLIPSTTPYIITRGYRLNDLGSLYSVVK